MIGLSFKQKIIVGCVTGALLITGVTAAILYQPETKTVEIYSQALESLQKGDFANSYYQFSKVSFLSNLKPIAIYHQAQAAHELGDDDAAVKQYQLLLSIEKNE